MMDPARSPSPPLRRAGQGGPGSSTGGGGGGVLGWLGSSRPLPDPPVPGGHQDGQITAVVKIPRTPSPVRPKVCRGSKHHNGPRSSPLPPFRSHAPAQCRSPRGRLERGPRRPRPAAARPWSGPNGFSPCLTTPVGSLSSGAGRPDIHRKGRPRAAPPHPGPMPGEAGVGRRPIAMVGHPPRPRCGADPHIPSVLHPTAATPCAPRGDRSRIRDPG